MFKGKSQNSERKKQKTAKGLVNSPKTIIVQGLPRGILTYNKNYDNLGTSEGPFIEILKKLFSVYGRITSCDQFIHYDIVSNVENFVHITYASSTSAARAHAAAANHKIKLNEYTFTVTLLSDGYTPIDKLNDYCLIKIFSLLEYEDRIDVERVCRRWKEVAPKSWYNVKEFNGKAVSPAEFKQYIVRCGRHLDHLTFSMFTPGASSLVKQHCPNLQRLTVFDSHSLSGRELYKVIKKLLKLRGVVLANFADRMESNFTKQLPESIEEIQLLAHETTMFPKKLTSQDYSRFCHLEKLVINNAVIEDESIRGLETLNSLTHLDINNCGDSICVLQQIQKLTNLRFLAVSHFPVSNSTLRNIVMSNQNLQYLDISYTKYLTEESLKIVSSLPHLKTLKMAHVRDVQLLCTAAMSNLEYLDCEGCREVDDEGLRRVIYTSPMLKYLNIRLCSVTNDLFTAAGAATEERDNDVALNIITEKSVSLTRCYPLLEITHIRAQLEELGGWPDSSSSSSSDSFLLGLKMFDFFSSSDDSSETD